jgi:enoyl-CoA hydratase/carnithine racemase
MEMNAPSPSPSTSQVILERQDADGVTTLTMDEPTSRNSLSEAMLEALGQTFHAIAADRSVRAVVLTARGPVFSSGHNLKEMIARRADTDWGRAYYAAIMGRCSAVMQQVVNLPQPVIAAVQGLATAAGCQLVASCDLAVASDQARFCTPGVNFGLFCSTPTVALSRNVVPKHAMEMLLLGQPVPADEAFRMGLVNRVVPAGEEVATAQALAAIIASKSALTVKTGKTAFYRQIDMTLAEAYDYASAVMVENMLARDAAEGIEALLAKREPQWEDR